MFGNIEFGGKQQNWGGQFDRLAFDDDGFLLFASVIADSAIIKGIRGTLNTDKKVDITASGVDAAKGEKVRSVGRLHKLASGYRDDIFRMPCNTVQAFFTTKARGFLLVADDAHLWAELMDVRYTTPLLPEWLPWIKERLIDRRLFRPAFCHRCSSASLVCTTKDLDGIVSEGLRDGMLVIPEEGEVAA
jgi:hypothetical protein